MLTQMHSLTGIAVIYLNEDDTKPTDCPNGSIAIEMNSTGNACNTYCFDADSKVWYQAPDWLLMELVS